ncbi:hypothetical protein D9M68_521330 [compost metagenome]
MALVTLHVVVGGGRQLGIEARVEGRLGGFVLALGGLHVGLGRFQQGVGVHNALSRGEQVGGHLGLDAGRRHQFIRRYAHGAEEAGLGIGQVHFLGVEVVLGQGQARFGLVEIGGAAHAALATQADLVVDTFVGQQVVPGQRDHLAPLEHVQVHLNSAQRQALGGAQGEVGAGVHHRLGTCHFVGCIETVEQHLPQAQFGITEIQGFLVVIAEFAGTGAVSLFPTYAGYQVDGR